MYINLYVAFVMLPKRIIVLHDGKLSYEKVDNLIVVSVERKLQLYSMVVVTDKYVK